MFPSQNILSETSHWTAPPTPAADPEIVRPLPQPVNASLVGALQSAQIIVAVCRDVAQPIYRAQYPAGGVIGLGSRHSFVARG